YEQELRGRVVKIEDHPRTVEVLQRLPYRGVGPHDGGVGGPGLLVVGDPDAWVARPTSQLHRRPGLVHEYPHLGDLHRRAEVDEYAPARLQVTEVRPRVIARRPAGRVLAVDGQRGTGELAAVATGRVDDADLVGGDRDRGTGGRRRTQRIRRLRGRRRGGRP